MRHRVTIVLSFLAASITSHNVLAQEDYEKKLDAITKAAAKICESVPMNQRSSEFILSANGKLELSGILKNLSDAGIDAATKYSSSESFGVLQKDLSGAIKDGNDCRSKIGSKLIDKLMGELDEVGKTKLASAQDACTTGNFPSARRIFNTLVISYPSNQQVISAFAQCEEVAETERPIDFSLHVSPAFLFAEAPQGIFTGRFTFEIDDSYCGRFSSTSGSMDEQSCNVTPGIHSISFKNITVYNSFGQQVVAGLRCGGQTRISTNVDKLGFIFCFKRPTVKCALREVDDQFENFGIGNCPS